MRKKKDQLAADRLFLKVARAGKAPARDEKTAELFPIAGGDGPVDQTRRDTDLAEGRRRRDEGMAATTKANEEWVDKAHRVALAMRSPGSTTTGEKIRKFIEAHGYLPDSPNAWGALTNSLRLKGYLIDTKEQTQMEDPKSHARRTTIWRWA